MTAFIKPYRSLLTATGRAINDFNMIHDGDRLLLGLSGEVNVVNPVLTERWRAVVQHNDAGTIATPEQEDDQPIDARTDIFCV